MEGFSLRIIWLNNFVFSSGTRGEVPTAGSNDVAGSHISVTGSENHLYAADNTDTLDFSSKTKPVISY